MDAILVGTALQSLEQRAGDCDLVGAASQVKVTVRVPVPEVRIETGEQIVDKCRVSERLTDDVGGGPRDGGLLARLDESGGMVLQLPVLQREVGFRCSEDGVASPLDCDLVKSNEENLGFHDRQHLLSAQNGLIRAISAGAGIDDRNRRQLFDDGWPAFVVLDLPAFGE